MQSPFSILIVDDEAMNAVSLQMQLRKAGYQQCRVATSVKQVLELVAQQPPDLLLMDIGLGERVDGIDLVNQLRQMFHGVQVIFMTGYTDAIYRQRAAELNPVAFFIKPVRFPELHQAIQNA